MIFTSWKRGSVSLRWFCLLGTFSRGLLPPPTHAGDPVCTSVVRFVEGGSLKAAAAKPGRWNWLPEFVCTSFIISDATLSMGSVSLQGGGFPLENKHTPTFLVDIECYRLKLPPSLLFLAAFRPRTANAVAGCTQGTHGEGGN